MALHAESYLHAVYPLRKPVELPRCFLLRWNNSKGKGKRRDTTWHECYGTKYPNGRVTLDFGPPYESMSELEETLDQAGEYTRDFLDEGQEKQA
jgi:hypothetical protein